MLRGSIAFINILQRYTIEPTASSHLTLLFNQIANSVKSSDLTTAA